MTTEVLRGVAEGAIKGLSDLAPGIAEYYYHTSMVWAVIAGVVIAASLIALFIGIKMGLKDDWELYEILIVVVACGILTCSLIIFIPQVDNIYLAKYFPEKFGAERIEDFVP